MVMKIAFAIVALALLPLLASCGIGALGLGHCSDAQLAAGTKGCIQ